MKLNGWIVYNGHLSGNKFLDFAQWLQNAAEKKQVPTKIIKNNHLLPILTSSGEGLIDIAKSDLPHFVIFGDKDIPLAKQLEQLNIPVYNSSFAIDVSDNKISTYQILAQHKLPIPRTIVAPKVFPGVGRVDTHSFKTAGEDLGFPLIIKEAYGSFGEQVYLIRSAEEMYEKIMELKDTPFVLQEFVATSFGRDARLNVVGGKVVAAMLRTAKDDFRANVSAGGTMEIYHPSEQEKQLAVAATKAIGADFAGVDLLFGESNEPIICEINSNAHIRNIYDCTKINVADYMIDYVLNQWNKKKG